MESECVRGVQAVARCPPRVGGMLFLLACVAAGPFLAACASQAPAAQDAASPDAARLFARACARCHGEDGSGGLPSVPNGPRPIDLRHADWQAARSDDEILAAIRDGRGAMPPFNDILSPAEVAALASYVRAIGRPPGD